MDQLVALRWVQQNIAALGEVQITLPVIGESAGGGSIVGLMTSPEAKGLFHKAITCPEADAASWMAIAACRRTRP